MLLVVAEGASIAWLSPEVSVAIGVGTVVEGVTVAEAVEVSLTVPVSFGEVVVSSSIELAGSKAVKVRKP